MSGNDRPVEDSVNAYNALIHACGTLINVLNKLDSGTSVEQLGATKFDLLAKQMTMLPSTDGIADPKEKHQLITTLQKIYNDLQVYLQEQRTFLDAVQAIQNTTGSKADKAEEMLKCASSPPPLMPHSGSRRNTPSPRTLPAEPERARIHTMLAAAQDLAGHIRDHLNQLERKAKPGPKKTG